MMDSTEKRFKQRISPFSVKLVHALQRLNELQDFIPLAIENKLPETKTTAYKL